MACLGTRTHAAIAVSVLTLATLTTALRALQPPTEPPTYPGARPEVRRHGYASARHDVLVHATPEQVLAWNNAPGRSLEEIVRFENFPAVVATTALVGDWTPGTREGDRRRVHFSDGHYLAEEVLVDTAEAFRYMIWGFTGPQRLTVDHGVAEFRFHRVDGGTRIEWVYSFLPRTRVLQPVVQRFLDRVMTPMMTATLDAMRTGIENDHRQGQCRSGKSSQARPGTRS